MAQNVSSGEGEDAEAGPVGEVQRYLASAGRHLRKNQWEEDGRSRYLLSCAQVLALLELADAIRSVEPTVEDFPADRDLGLEDEDDLDE